MVTKFVMELKELRIILRSTLLSSGGFPGGSVVKNSPAKAGDTGDMDLIPGSGRSSGGGHDNPLQYSCLEKPWTEEPVGYIQSMGSQRTGHD